MLSVFWDKERVIMTDYLENGHTIPGDHYSNQLKNLREAIKERRRGKIRKGILLLHDNAPAHTSRKAAETARECGYEILSHPPYSPDLAPSDFFLFPKLKKDLKGMHLESDNEVIEAVEGWFSGKEGVFYSQGLFKVKRRWQKCVTVGGDYIEKD